MLKEKIGVVLGVANKRSISWNIAKAADREGARLVITYQGERLLRGIKELCEQQLTQEPILVPCDVSSDEQMDVLFETIRSECGALDFLVHGLAFSKREELMGAFHDSTLENWRLAMQISAYSLSALTRRAVPLMEGRRGSILTLTYIGGERVIPHYNVMGACKAALEASVRYLAVDLGPHGHRVNGISAGPIKTLAAAGVRGFSQMLDVVASRSPMQRNVEAAEVGDAALFFLSDLSRAVTGDVLFVDCGYHAMGI
ncbi:MAG: enoyl-[acyl-carrier-protein] reductase FabI [Planctomycetes bacterium]|nr:enoyl-[acyl-carrier-protein] reductase FabI [Planctomycetota bacterium]